jgi:hypothetical protein
MTDIKSNKKLYDVNGQIFNRKNTQRRADVVSFFNSNLKSEKNDTTSGQHKVIFLSHHRHKVIFSKPK